MHVKVKQRHINQGKPHQSYGCPVALALNDASGFSWSVGVSSATEFGPHSVYQHCIGLPQAAIDWVRLFDMGQPVSPFEFDI